MASTEKLQRENHFWPKKNKKADLTFAKKHLDDLQAFWEIFCGQTREKLTFLEGFHGSFATSGLGWPAIIDETMTYALYKEMFK